MDSFCAAVERGPIAAAAVAAVWLDAPSAAGGADEANVVERKPARALAVRVHAGADRLVHHKSAHVSYKQAREKVA